MTGRATRADPPDYSRLGEGPLDACHRGGTFAHIVSRVAGDFSLAYGQRVRFPLVEGEWPSSST